MSNNTPISLTWTPSHNVKTLHMLQIKLHRCIFRNESIANEIFKISIMKLNFKTRKYVRNKVKIYPRIKIIDFGFVVSNEISFESFAVDRRQTNGLTQLSICLEWNIVNPVKRCHQLFKTSIHSSESIVQLGYYSTLWCVCPLFPKNAKTYFYNSY